MKRLLTLAGVLVLLGVGTAGTARADLGTVLTVPNTIPSGCSADAQPALAAFIAGVPDHSVIVFPSGSCYLLDAPLVIFGHAQLDLEGAGSTLRSGVTTPEVGAA